MPAKQGGRRQWDLHLTVRRSTAGVSNFLLHHQMYIDFPGDIVGATDDVMTRV